ncbi:hypothetical protein [Amycolatopsis sp. NPDC021455]|uniref:hypothetical protein n=1 Tax=Amycolatopsis sp. NPDC021455 TaxID=3154901 RepID=UPI0033C81331
MGSGDVARKALACVRIFNGALGLFAPGRMARSLGSEPGEDKRFGYPARMFGIRTLVLGGDLLLLKVDDPSARRILGQAVLIHATDTAAAAHAAARGELQGKAAKFTVAISAVNTLLAVISLATAKRRG